MEERGAGVHGKVWSGGRTRDEAFEKDDVTFCIWREVDGDGWRCGEVAYSKEDDGGMTYLLGYIHDTAEAYAEFAAHYYECDIDLDTIKQIYQGSPITRSMIRKLNPNRDIDHAMKELGILQQ
ncbi:hypothetical protein JQN58_01410 [Aneurinibacillus sp. BA2021]|nr:hypothetical protein [Aneurinibacillus sp. BA2021]